MKKTAVLSLLALLAVGAWMGLDSSSALSLEHAVRTHLKSHSIVTTLSVEGVGRVPFFLNPADKVITPGMWAGNLWEATETKWFVQSLRRGDVVVDVGANIGYYTVLAGLLVGETGRVYAFEPDPVGFEILRQNVVLNGLHNVVLEQKAVSNESGSLRLFLAQENKGDHRIYQPEGEERPFVDVEAVRLDDYLRGLDEFVDFVKVDTQGAELAILAGAADTVSRSPDLVMAVEYSPQALAGFGSSGEALVDLIKTFGFQMFDLGMGGPNLYPIRATTPDSLRSYPPKGWFFTNLLLVKGRPDIIKAIRDERRDDRSKRKAP